MELPLKGDPPGGVEALLDETDFWSADLALQYPESYPASVILDRIESEKSGLVEHLKRICLDPEMEVSETSWNQTRGTANVWWFDDLPGAILQLRSEAIREAEQRLAGTEITKSIRANLDFCYRQGRMILIEGNPGLGKSVSARAWCESMGGTARYVEVPPGNDDKSFYVKVAGALGVANGASYNGQQIKLRVDEALRASGLMLVLDEASRLWPQQNRPRGLPSRMLWIMGTFDSGTPIALLGFKFSDWRELYTTQTRWPDEQFERRLNRNVPLPSIHSVSDLRAIAESILPEADEQTYGLMMAIATMHAKKAFFYKFRGIFQGLLGLRSSFPQKKRMRMR